MSNLNTAKILGQGVYTKEEVNIEVAASNSGEVRRILKDTNYDNNLTSTSTAWIKLTDFSVTFDTTKYNYFIEFGHGVNVQNSSATGGMNDQIRINNVVVGGSGHRGHGMNNGAYFDVVTSTELITDGFIGTFLVSTYFATYTAGKTVTLHNNGGVTSTNQWKADQLNITVYELYK